jgi:2-methylcitrate dehydratase
MRSGERKSFREEYHRGHPRNPMTDADIEMKFRFFAGKMLTSSQVDALVQKLWNLQALPDVGTLISMTVPVGNR